MANNIDSVKEFWEDNPLFTGESEFEPGSKDFFEDHRKVYYEDVFADKFDRKKYIPEQLEGKQVLDLGCGIGFWTIEILENRGGVKATSADLTQNALKITEERLSKYDLTAELSQQNAEALTFEDETFDHVNCQGVIHHTPNTEKCVAEIARVIKKGGSASISVYYRNFFLRNWKWLSAFGKFLSRLGAGLKGRGREKIFSEGNVDEITRLYDGDKNPIGKSYTKKQFLAMVTPYFEVKKTFLFFFPARALPFKLPKGLHRWLANTFGFMIHVNLIKK